MCKLGTLSEILYDVHSTCYIVGIYVAVMCDSSVGHAHYILPEAVSAVTG